MEGDGLYLSFAGDIKVVVPCSTAHLFILLTCILQRRVFLVGIIPPKANVKECLGVLMQDLQLFEDGFAMMYGPTQQYEGFYGGVFQFTGVSYILSRISCMCLQIISGPR